MRIIMGFLALVMAILPFGGVAQASPEGKRIMLLGTSSTHPYIGVWTSTFNKLATQAGMKVTNLSANFDAAVQSQQMDDAIAQKADLIAIVYINDQAIIPALTRAKAAGIPVMLVISPLKKEYDDLYTTYVGADHYELGRLAGEEIIQGLKAVGKNKAQIVAVTGVAQQLNVQLRMAGFKEALAKHPGFELVASEDGRWNTAMTEKITSELLVRFNARGGVDGVFTMADNQATGAINAIESAGLKVGVANKGVVVVASNCLKDGILHIKSGQQYATASQIPSEEAATAVKKIVDYFNGEKLKKHEMVVGKGITKDNVDQFAAGCSY